MVHYTANLTSQGLTESPMAKLNNKQKFYQQKLCQQCRLVITSCALVACALFLGVSAVAENQNTFHDALVDEFSDVSQAYYSDIAKSLKNGRFVFDNMRSLNKSVRELVANKKEPDAISVILANSALILRNVDNDYVPSIIQLLLDHSVWDSAAALSERVIAQGDAFSSSKIHYLLGSYYFDRELFDESIQHLTSIESSDALNPKERDYATIMFGIALQKNKKHREALKIYEQIGTGSVYYGYAQLNSAIAQIRQGWWTDAQISIEKALTKKTPKSLKEVQNRLLLVLAYSQLQNEFYRNARLTFRKISLDSRYVNRALLGIGLCALHQKDYSGALNAFTRLQKSNSDELSVIESYLLIPFTFDRTKELKKASSHYTEAIAYFGNKTRGLDQKIAAIKQSNNFVDEINWLNELPTITANNYRLLRAFTNPAASTKTQRMVSAYQQKLHAHIEQRLIAVTVQKIESINSYQSQSQYGLAKLYDSQ